MDGLAVKAQTLGGRSPLSPSPGGSSAAAVQVQSASAKCKCHSLTNKPAGRIFRGPIWPNGLKLAAVLALKGQFVFVGWRIILWAF